MCLFAAVYSFGLFIVRAEDFVSHHILVINIFNDHHELQVKPASRMVSQFYFENIDRKLHLTPSPTFTVGVVNYITDLHSSRRQRKNGRRSWWVTSLCIDLTRHVLVSPCCPQKFTVYTSLPALDRPVLVPGLTALRCCLSVCWSWAMSRRGGGHRGFLVNSCNRTLTIGKLLLMVRFCGEKLLMASYLRSPITVDFLGVMVLKCPSSWVLLIPQVGSHSFTE